MARKEVVVNVCDRCPVGRERPALPEPVRLALGGQEWELDLCAEHAAQLEREVYAWGRLGHEVEQLTRFTPQAKADALRVAELRTTQAAEDRERDVERLFTPAELVGPLDSTLETLPFDAGSWVFTDHARERLVERGISVRDALLAACRPKIKRPAKDRHLTVHIGTTAKAVVDAKERVIVTVAIPDAQPTRRIS